MNEIFPSLISTRGDAQKASFVDVLLAGLAPDGGLYVVSLTDNVIYKITRKP